MNIELHSVTTASAVIEVLPMKMIELYFVTAGIVLSSSYAAYMYIYIFLLQVLIIEVLYILYVGLEKVPR